MKKPLPGILFCLISLSTFAQQESGVGDNSPAAFGKVSVNYTSNSVYNGRKDSLATPYVTPAIGYYAKSGFFIDGSLSYLSQAGSSRIDLFNIETGYDFSFDQFDGEIAANKNFYNASSTNVRSEVQGGLSASAGYDFGFIRPSLEGQLNFGHNTDYAAAFGLGHAFHANDDQLQISPAVVVNASTENYYGDYYSRRRYAALRRKAGTGSSYEITADLSDVSRFKLQDYEFSLPVNYSVKHFSFGFTPVYAIPVNPAVVTVQVTSSGGGTASRTFTEKISNSFYASFEVGYKF